MSSNRATAVNPGESKPVPVFLLAVWFGLATGLVEASTYLIFEATGLLSWQTNLRAVNPNIFWASTLVDLFVFLIVASFLKPFLRLLGRRALGVAITTFATLGFYAFLAVSGRITETGALICGLGLGTVVNRWVSRDADRRLQFITKTAGPLALTAAAISLGVVFGTPVVERFQMGRLPAPPRNAPNVLLIVLDTLRADRLGSYGYARPTTPFLDRFAREGVLFEKAFANAPWTLPSHVSLFTGYLPSQHGATSGRYDGRFPTLAQEFAKDGYATAGIVANDSFGSRTHGFALGFIHWENGFINLEDSAARTALGRRIRRYFFQWFKVTGYVDHLLSPEINRRCLRWLDSRPDRPFFLFLNYMDVHTPLVPPRKFAEKFSAEPDVISPSLEMGIARGEGVKTPDFPRRNEAYDAALASMDEQLGKLFDELRRRNLDRNTLVIFVGDHGESLGEHGLDEHGNSVYREQLQVPLLVRFPGVAPAGQRVAETAGLQDIPATIAELASLPHPSFPGVSLARWWQGRAPENGMVVSELERPRIGGMPKNWPVAQGWLKSVTDNHWHFILQEHGKRELFNLDADAKEENDVGGLAESQARMEEMKRQLEKELGAGAIHTAREALRPKP
jgi:arylsulfatase A-like enzyme